MTFIATFQVNYWIVLLAVKDVISSLGKLLVAYIYRETFTSDAR